MSNTLSSPARPALLATRRHTSIFLLILAGVSVAGAVQSRRAYSPPEQDRSHVGIYCMLVGVQLMWLRYIHIGMKAKGRRIEEFFAWRGRNATGVLADVAVAIVTLFVLNLLVVSARMLFGSIHARTAFLLPRGTLEAILWVFVSLTAGFCEEVAFRGYLQRQLWAITGSAGLALLLQAAIFGASHGYEGVRAASIATAFGLVFGCVAWWRGNIRAAILAHAFIDIIAGLRWL